MSQDIAMFATDGTLADVSAWIHHVRQRPRNWSAVFAGMAQDKAIHSVVRLCNLLYDEGVRVASADDCVCGRPAISVCMGMYEL